MLRKTLGICAALTAFVLSLTSAQAAGDTVLVFGGNRATGLEAVKTLVAQKDKVTVFVRPTSDVAELKTLGVNLVTGDVLQADDVKKAFASAKFTAVVSALGGSRGAANPDFEGIKNIADAAKTAGVKRIVMVTAIGVGDSTMVIPEPLRTTLRATLIEKGKAEDYLVASGLDYTVIRPGGLRTGAATGKATLTEEHTQSSSIRRVDLGKLVAETVSNKKTYKKIYHAIDPTLGNE